MVFFVHFFFQKSAFLGNIGCCPDFLNYALQTPGHVIKQDVCSFLPDSFNRISISKVATSVFTILFDILLAFNHCKRNLRSLLADLFISLTESFILREQVLSVKRNVFYCFTPRFISLIYVRTQSGLNLDEYQMLYVCIVN